MDFHHVSVLLKETIDLLNVQPGKIYIDCTLGGGGHSSEILRRLGGTGKLIAFDQDPMAIKAAAARLSNIANNFTLINRNFSNLGEFVKEHCPQGVDGIVFDLGVSSPQLDQAERGFSYMQDAPLDMRMDPGSWEL